MIELKRNELNRFNISSERICVIVSLAAAAFRNVIETQESLIPPRFLRHRFILFHWPSLSLSLSLCYSFSLCVID